MPNTLSLDEATTVIAQINTLDAKLQSLIDNCNEKLAKIDNNNSMITRMETLKKENEVLKNATVQLKSEIEEIKSEINSKAKLVKDSGWVIPIPKREVGISGTVRM